jgi:hypothetical protein
MHELVQFLYTALKLYAIYLGISFVVALVIFGFAFSLFRKVWKEF